MNYLDLFFSRKLAISMEGSTEGERNKINVLLIGELGFNNKTFFSFDEWPELIL